MKGESHCLTVLSHWWESPGTKLFALVLKVTLCLSTFGVVPEHVLKRSILMKQKINVLQFRVGGRLRKKKYGGFCFLSRKVYINDFPSRPSVVLLQTTKAFVSQILLHLTFSQSPHISSSPRDKKNM